MGVWFTCLKDDEYVMIDYPSGKTIEYGPGVKWYCCGSATVNESVRVNNDQYLKITHLAPGGNNNSLMEIVSGPCLYRPDDPYGTISKIEQKIRLSTDEYIITKDIQGQMKTVEGPTLYCPKPY